MRALVCCRLAGSCARVSYLPCPLVKEASLCPYWDMFTRLFLLSKLKFSFFLPRELLREEHSLNVLGPEIKERRGITVLHIYYVERFLEYK